MNLSKKIWWGRASLSSLVPVFLSVQILDFNNPIRDVTGNLIRLLLYFCDAFIDRLPASVAFFEIVPMSNLFLSHLPAEQNRLAVNYARKIEQTQVQIFHLNAGRI